MTVAEELYETCEAKTAKLNDEAYIECYEDLISMLR